VVESLDPPELLDALEQHMRPQHIVLGEVVRVAEAQVNVCMRRKVEDCIDIMLLQTSQDIVRLRYIAVEEVEVRLALQHAGIVQTAAIVELVERDDVVCIWILDGQVSDQPRATTIVSERSRRLAMGASLT